MWISRGENHSWMLSNRTALSSLNGPDPIREKIQIRLGLMTQLSMQRCDPNRVEEWHQALLRRYRASEHYRSRYTQQSKDNYVAVLDFLAWFEGNKVRHNVLKEQFVVRRESTNRRLRVVAETVIPGKPMIHRPVPPEKRMYVHQLSVILEGLIKAGFVERCEERPLTMHAEMPGEPPARAELEEQVLAVTAKGEEHRPFHPLPQLPRPHGPQDDAVPDLHADHGPPQRPGLDIALETLHLRQLGHLVPDERASF